VWERPVRPHGGRRACRSRGSGCSTAWPPAGAAVALHAGDAAACWRCVEEEESRRPRSPAQERGCPGSRSGTATRAAVGGRRLRVPSGPGRRDGAGGCSASQRRFRPGGAAVAGRPPGLLHPESSGSASPSDTAARASSSVRPHLPRLGCPLGLGVRLAVKLGGQFRRGRRGASGRTITTWRHGLGATCCGRSPLSRRCAPRILPALLLVLSAVLSTRLDSADNVRNLD